MMDDLASWSSQRVRFVAVDSFINFIDIAGDLPVQFRFVQLEHRGGFCDCWAVANFTVIQFYGQSDDLL